MRIAPRERPGWKAWALGIARAVGERGDCTRRWVGAVILDKDHRIIGAGYNGTMPGGPSCLKGECPRGLHYPGLERWPDGKTRIEVCACGKDWPCPEAVPPGSSYDTGPGVCHASHAEQTALADVEARYRLDGAVMVITHEPCDGCLKQIRNTTRIAQIIWPDGELDLLPWPEQPIGLSA